MSSSPVDEFAAFFENDSAPQQIPTVHHQTTSITFPTLPRSCQLSVDASPGCGGVVWPAGTVSSPSFSSC